MSIPATRHKLYFCPPSWAGGTRSQASNVLLDKRKDRSMKISTVVLAAGLVAMSSFAIAESGAPSGQGSTTGDPAASSQNANPSTTGMSPSKSGSGTATSGGAGGSGEPGREDIHGK